MANKWQMMSALLHDMPTNLRFLECKMDQKMINIGTAMPRLEILHKDEHFMLTDVQWDPSSRRRKRFRCCKACIAEFHFLKVSNLYLS